MKAMMVTTGNVQCGGYEGNRTNRKKVDCETGLVIQRNAHA